MIFNASPFLAYLQEEAKVYPNPFNRFLVYLIQFLQKRLGVEVVRKLDGVLNRQVQLVAPSLLAKQLLRAGIIKFINRTNLPCDLPRMYLWSALLNIELPRYTGGASSHSSEQALYATLAEALERYLWVRETDFFDSPLFVSERDIRLMGKYIPALRFTGFTNEQRKKKFGQDIDDNSKFLWIKSSSLIEKSSVYIPAQIASAAVDLNTANEPVIRQQVTGGLATWNTSNGAQLGGLLELIERDAYFITWLNQLTLPRINLATSSDLLSPSLKKLLLSCSRYQFKVTVVQMATDAPTFATMVVVEDVTKHTPQFHIGLNAHYTFSKAVEGALMEALRAVTYYREYFASGKTWDPATPLNMIDHQGRSLYWGEPDKAPGLEFLVKGPMIDVDRNVSWLNDDDVTHFARLLNWCRTNDYECVSVPLTKSKKNTTKLHVEVVIIPELYPVYLLESHQHHFVGKRITDVPEKLGYKARPQPYFDEPHPFY